MNDKKTYIIVIASLLLIILAILWVRGYQDNKQYRSEIKSLKGKISQYTETNQQLSKENQRFAETVSQLRKQLNEYQSRIKQAREIVTGLQGDTQTISGELSSAIDLIQSITEELQKVKKILTDNNRN